MVFTCQVCGSEDYAERDGGFYCVVCGMQSQEYFVQEQEDDNLERGVMRHELSQAKNEQVGRKPKESLGHSWTLYEAYQIIILAQADALVAHGASTDLKEVIYTLWANYLSKLGVAFSAAERIIPEDTERKGAIRKRELFGGATESLQNVGKKDIKKNAKKKKVSGKVKKRLLSDVEDEEEPKDPKETMSSKRLQRTAQRMDLKRTIAFCYIGLMYTNPDILPCDVIRWIYEGNVPFLSCTHLLSEDMVFSSLDSHLFNIERFDADILIAEVNKLMKFLKLTGIPDPDLNAVAFRFIRQLCLPEKFNLFVLRLIKNIKCTGHRKDVYNKSEELALAYIILALKIIFGLDNSSERKLSALSQELQNLIHPQTKLFVWSEWQEFLVEKQSHEFDAYFATTSDITSSNITDLDEILQCHSNMKHDKKRLSTFHTLTKRGRKEQHFDHEFREFLAKPLSTGLASCDRISEDSSRKNTKDMQIKAESFIHSTVCHLTDLDACANKLKRDQTSKDNVDSLIHQLASSRPKFYTYSLPAQGVGLASVRHSSYIWLLDAASRAGHCSKESIDKIVCKLSQTLLGLNSLGPSS